MRKIKLIITSLILVSPFAANAQDTITVTISGFGAADGQWEVSLLGPTTYAASSTELESQIWWDDVALAAEFSNLVNSALGAPNDFGGPNFQFGPFFAYGLNTGVGDILSLFWDGGSTEQAGTTYETDVITFAVASRVNAEIVRVTYTGFIDFLEGDGFGFSAGDEITGWFEYDPDDLVVNSFGQYRCFFPCSTIDSNFGDGGYPDEKDFVVLTQDATNNVNSILIYDRSELSDFSYIYDDNGVEVGYTTIEAFGESYIEAGFIGGGEYSSNGQLTMIEHRETCLYGFDCEYEDIRNVAAFAGISYTTGPVTEVLLEQLGTGATNVGPGTSFADKIMLAQTYLEVPDEESACLILDDFLNQVRAQRGKKLTEEQADQFTADAERLQAAIGCD